MRRAAAAFGRLGQVLVDPSAVARTAGFASPAALAVAWVAAAALLGCATLPRQLELLAALTAPLGFGEPAGHRALLGTGVARMMLADRLVPPPTLLLTAVLLVLGAEPVLALARERRRALVAVAIVGLAPVLVARLGELLVVWMTPAGAVASLGDVVTLPNRFETGVLLFRRAPEPAPAWLEVVDARVNLVSLWCVALWAAGLRALDGVRFAPWHALLPAACLVGAGLATWALAPLVLPVIVRGF